MLADLPASYHASEDIHEHRNIDEVSVEADIRYIANPDLITSTDVKCFKAIHPRLHTFKRPRGLTGNPFDRNRQVLGFHKSCDASIPNGVSHTQQHLRDTPISIFRITRT